MWFRAAKYFLVITAVVSLLSCVHKAGDKSNIEDYNIQNPNTANGKSDFSKLPAFKFAEEEFNFGTLIQGEKVSHSFVFTNVGGSNLIIKEVKASCGCTTPKWTKDPVKPGEKGVIEVIFDSAGRSGEQSKTVKIEANTQPNIVELRIHCEVVDE